MAIYKRGKVYWFEFEYEGERIRESTGVSNERDARKVEAARRTQLALGEVGLEKRKKTTLKEFAERFEKHIETECAEKPYTVSFYKAKLKALLAYPPLASARLDKVDEALIAQYVDTRKRTKSRRNLDLSPASVNRELATLRKLLRLAHEWRELQRVPRIRLLRGERNREFTFSQEQERLYLGAVPTVLADVAVVLLDTGLRIGELLSLEWPQTHLEPASGARFGYVTISSGKAKSSKLRNVPLTPRASATLAKWKREGSGLVFHDGTGGKLVATLLNQQHARARNLLRLPADCVLHSMRHTYGTRLGESGADAFTIMRLMGHSTVTVSQRYVHPTPHTLESAVERMANLGGVPTKSPTVDRADSAVAS